MKRLWLGIGILAVILALSLMAMGCLGRMTDQTASLLEEAWQLSETGNQAQALALANQARARWTARYGLAASFMDHEELEEVTVSFAELQAWGALEKREEFAVRCRSLACLLRELGRGERLLYYTFL